MVVNTINELITLLNQVDTDAQVLAAISNDAANATGSGLSPGFVTTRLGDEVKNVQKVIADAEAAIAASGVTRSGTPTPGQVATWISDTTIEGRPEFTFSSDTATLEIVGAIPRVQFSDSDTPGVHNIFSTDALLTVSADPTNAEAGSGIQFSVDGNEVVRFNDSGFVGIGRNTPTATLDIESSNPTILLRDSDALSGGYASILADETGSILIAADVTNAEASSDIIFQLDGAEVGRFRNGGNFGVGVNAPGDILHLASTNPAIRIEDTDEASYALIGKSGVNLLLEVDPTNTEAASTIRFTIDGGEVARLTDTGRFGISETTPDSSFHITDAASVSMTLQDTAGADTHEQTRISNDAGDFRIGVYDSTGVFVSNDYLINRGATGAINHFWRINNNNRMQLDTDGVLRLTTTTVASLPTAASVGEGARFFVTDANATTFASVVAGGGANGVPVYSDGTDWRIG